MNNNIISIVGDTLEKKDFKFNVIANALQRSSVPQCSSKMHLMRQNNVDIENEVRR